MAKHERSAISGEYVGLIDSPRGEVGGGECGELLYTENMYFSHERGILESIPGIRELWKLNNGIFGIAAQQTKSGACIVIHSNEDIYRLSEDDLLSGVAPSYITDVEDRAISFSQLGDKLYGFNGRSILTVDGDGGYSVTDYENANLSYIPTTYVNGVRHEKKNLLSNYFYENYRFDSADDYSFGSPELTYSIIDKEKKKCAVVGISNGYGEVIHIPRYKKLGGVDHLVTEIAANAFTSKKGIKKIITNRGLERICSAAFLAMPDLERVYVSDSVTEIGDYCFAMCFSLTNLEFGVGLRKIGKAAFSGCDRLTVDYAGSSEMFSEIENLEAFGPIDINYQVSRKELTVAVPIFTTFKSISQVTVNGEDTPYLVIDGEHQIVITVPSRGEIAGKDITVFGTVENDGRIFKEAVNCKRSAELILGCTRSFVYDGRIFLTGNPEYPSTVFYNETNADGVVVPFYFSDVSFFTVSAGDGEVSAFSTVGQSLAVFVHSSFGGDTVRLFKPKRTDNGTYYNEVASYSHPSVRAAINCLGESIATDGTVVTRFRGSSGSRTAFETVSAPSTDFPKISTGQKPLLAEWGNYLALAQGDKIMLCDLYGRQGFDANDGYRWYRITEAAGYAGDKPLYVYADEPYGAFSVNRALAGSPVSAALQVRSITTTDGESVLYVSENSDGLTENYRVYKTPYRHLGTPATITALISLNGRLIIGTDDGVIATLNTDMYGVAPEHVRTLSGFDADEYERLNGSSLHPFYYSHLGHVPTFKAVTVPDDCEKPYLEKSTVRSSAAIGIKPIFGKVVCDAIYDLEKRVRLGVITAAELNFSALDFGNASLSSAKMPTVRLPHAKRGWLSISFSFESEGLSPFGLSYVAYRYTLDDNLNNNSN